MRPLVQKLPLSENTSFVCRTYRTPHFETPWHQHAELELLLITEGYGTALIGSYMGPYQTGDVFLLGPNLPHWFRKATDELVGSAIVVHFDETFLGRPFLGLPEVRDIAQLLHEATYGLQLGETLRGTTGEKLIGMETSHGFANLMLLLDCLNTIAQRSDHRVLTHDVPAISAEDSTLIGTVFVFTFNQFKRSITVQEVADLCRMSLSTFSRFFKRSTKKSYLEFLKEVRTGHACKLLIDTRQTVSQICFESGYNNLANFNRQFKESKGVSPGDFRKRFVNSKP
ncbi:MAG: helix-turn-helix transcriptional regulator [Bacteroidetes bacterium]|nr:helix-turn-helix transcriptional regulator [Fibrella sp.]